MPQPLKVFLCHAHSDKDTVKALYISLEREGVDVWLDKEKLLPGADWEYEIRKAVRESDVVIVCLSKQFKLAGFRQTEVRIALEEANKKPEGEIFIIPARLEECDNLESLSRWHWVDLFENDGFQRLILALRIRADKIGAALHQHGVTSSRPNKNSEQQDVEKEYIESEHYRDEKQVPQRLAQEQVDRETVEKVERLKKESNVAEKIALEKLEREKTEHEVIERETAARLVREKELVRFVQIQPNPFSEEGTYYLGKYPVTNAQYERFLTSNDYFNVKYWKGFPKFKDGQEKGNWDIESLAWLKEKKPKFPPYFIEDKQPKYWNHLSLGKIKPEHPVVGITWLEANAYCLWLKDNWGDLPESLENPRIFPRQVRLPTRDEWVIAAGGDQPGGRFPWDRRKAQTLTGWDRLGELPLLLKLLIKFSKRFKSYWQVKVENIKIHANVSESRLGNTSSVMEYPLGESPFGVQDMSGNVWEWMSDYVDGRFILSGGSWNESLFYARVGYRYDSYNFRFGYAQEDVGFRILIK